MTGVRRLGGLQCIIRYVTIRQMLHFASDVSQAASLVSLYSAHTDDEVVTGVHVLAEVRQSEKK